MNKKQRRAWRKVKGIWPEKDPAFIAWLHFLPCVACHFAMMIREGHPIAHALACYIARCESAAFMAQTRDDIEAAHIGDRGQAQKCSDREACPLCKIHHDRGSAVGHHVLGKHFWTRYGIPKGELIQALNALYDSPQ